MTSLGGRIPEEEEVVASEDKVSQGDRVAVGKRGQEDEEEEENGAEAQQRLQEDLPLKSFLRTIGTVVGKLHKAGIVHGDLTTSNMMLQPTSPSTTANGSAAKASLDGDIVLIDFGLSSQSSSDEDRAVDLYVLERAFGSTHPRAEVIFPEVLEGYRGALPAKQATSVMRKLEDVRMRGRKRSMVG